MMENRTDVKYEDYTQYKAGVLIWKVVPPILIIFGTCGNVLSIVILTSRTIRKSSTALYFIFLTFTDLAVLYTGLLRQWLIYLFDLDIRRINEAACKTHTWLVYCSLDFSAWTLIAVTLERIIAVWYPYNKKRICSQRNALLLQVSILITVLGLNAHFLYGMVHVDTGSGIQKCAYTDTVYAGFINKVWSWIDLCMFCLIPFTVIVIGNGLILFKVAKTRRKSGPAQSKMGPRNIDNQHSSMTAILITLNTVFLITTLPISIYNIGHSRWSSSKDPVTLARLDLWWAVVNMLMYTNNAVNFLLYSLSGSQFRQEVKRILCGIYNRSNMSTPLALEALLEENDHTSNNLRKSEQNGIYSNKSLDNHTIKQGSVLDKCTLSHSYALVNSNILDTSERKASNALKHDSLASEDVLAESVYNEEFELRAPIAVINETNRVSYAGDADSVESA